MLSYKAMRISRILKSRFGLISRRHNWRTISTVADPSEGTNTQPRTQESISANTGVLNANTEMPTIIDGRRKVSVKPDKLVITGKPIEQKIIYNTAIAPRSMKATFQDTVRTLVTKDVRKRKEERNTLLYSHVDTILIEKYLYPTSSFDTEEQPSVGEQSETSFSEPHFPYSSFVTIDRESELKKASQEPNAAPNVPTRERNVLTGIATWKFDYGTPDENVRPSKEPCGGCGAYLHCQNPAIPGYIPSELFHGKTVKELRKCICQRCRFLREHDVALNVNISPEDYPKVLSHIQDKYALVLLVVDLLDFPGSIWPDILSVIGRKRPVFVVGNKVDLVPQDGRHFLKRLTESLESAIETTGLHKANIKGISLVSARTGYGVEELITKLQSKWAMKGDVYLVGCTNVGKSSLFNALLQSDFCKTQAIDLLQRATVSPWPGTTLNLLKFPMLRPSGIRLYERVKRLQAERQNNIVEEQFRKMQLKETKDPTYSTLIGHIGRTFEIPKDPLIGKDPFAVNAERVPKDHLGTVNPEDVDYRDSKWCYDTPGTVQPDQILPLLTLEELVFVLPNRAIEPRTFILKPGQTFFLAGLGRIDYLEGPHGVLLTAFRSHALPLTIIPTEHADELYKEALETRLFRVPQGNTARLEAWPGLRGRDVDIQGNGSWNTSVVDLVLSSAGWVSITAGGEGTTYRFFVSTPEGRGIFVRDPPLLPFAVRLRGNRNVDQSYGKSDVYVSH